MPINKMNDNLEAAQDYGNKAFLGRTVGNADATGVGRFQVNVPGLFDDGELPQVGIIRYSPFGIGKNFGWYGSPWNGSSAVLRLQDGDASYPIAEGYLLTQQDVHPEFTDPNVWGYVDPNGTMQKVDLTQETFTFKHVSGTTYTIDQQGNLVAHVVGNREITVDGNSTLTVVGNTTINTTGATNINTNGSTTIDTKGSTLVKSVGDITLDAPTVRVTNQLIVSGLTRLLGGVIISGDNGSGSAGTITGNLIHTNGILSSNGVILHTHVHPNGGGGSDTGSPVPGS
ncbi:MAG: hypothetical protein ACN6OP_15090 [Pseudomonadales bacterium]